MIPFDNNTQPPAHHNPLPRRQLSVVAVTMLKLLSVLVSVLLIWHSQWEIQRMHEQKAATQARIWSDAQGPATNASITELLTASAEAKIENLEETVANHTTTLHIVQAFIGVTILPDLLLAWGLWMIRPWARTWTLGLAWFSVGLGIAGMCLPGRLSLPISIVLNGSIIWYLMRESVQEVFYWG